MLLPTSRIQLDNGIMFYEQDILCDDYIYSGDFDVTLNLEYVNPGFGIALINSEGLSLTEKEEVLLFKISNKIAEVIYKNKDSQKVLATFNSSYAKTHTDNLTFRLSRTNNKYELYVGTQKVCSFKAPCELKSYNLAYYSNVGNVIKNINIASSIPYGWIVNMQNTNGGYIEFTRDSFELKQCQNQAEIEQVNIDLETGKYFLKYDKSEDCDIKAYAFYSDDTRMFDDEKNILSIDGSFEIKHGQKVNVKFKGTRGKMKKIYITTLKDNDYVRTSPDKGDKVDIDGSYIKLYLDEVSEATWKGTVNFVPGMDHTSPYDYSVIETVRSYGLYDVDIALGVEYDYGYSNKTLSIKKGNNIIKTINVVGNIMTIFKNVNAVLTDFIVKDIEGKDKNIIVENTIKKYVPGVISSPIIVTDQYDNPFDLSTSYRIFEKNSKPFFWFTNVEREYFKPAHSIKLSKRPSDKTGTIIAYGIKDASKLDMSKLLFIEKEGKDTVDACANLYDIIFEKDMRYIDKTNGEIRFTDLSDYKLIIVDYLKADSYCINYKHHLGSYEVDISAKEDEDVKVIYDNTEKEIDGIEYINEQQYLHTGIIPSSNCYIILGR
jgi:hypothetical protein